MTHLSKISGKASTSLSELKHSKSILQLQFEKAMEEYAEIVHNEAVESTVMAMNKNQFVKPKYKKL